MCFAPNNCWMMMMMVDVCLKRFSFFEEEFQKLHSLMKIVSRGLISKISLKLARTFNDDKIYRFSF